jgi:hypothetical protein
MQAQWTPMGKMVVIDKDGVGRIVDKPTDKAA